MHILLNYKLCNIVMKMGNQQTDTLYMLTGYPDSSPSSCKMNLLLDLIQNVNTNDLTVIKDLLIRKSDGGRMKRDEIHTSELYDAVKVHEKNTLDINRDHQLLVDALLQNQGAKRRIVLFVLDDDVYTGISLTVGKSYLEEFFRHFVHDSYEFTCVPLTLRSGYLLDGIVANTQSVKECVASLLSNDSIWRKF